MASWVRLTGYRAKTTCWTCLANRLSHRLFPNHDHGDNEPTISSSCTLRSSVACTTTACIASRILHRYAYNVSLKTKDSRFSSDEGSRDYSSLLRYCYTLWGRLVITLILVIGIYHPSPLVDPIINIVLILIFFVIRYCLSSRLFSSRPLIFILFLVFSLCILCLLIRCDSTTGLKIEPNRGYIRRCWCSDRPGDINS